MEPVKVYNDIYPFLEPDNFKDAHRTKVVLITGAGGAIGQAIAQRFAMAGASNLVLLDLTEESLIETAQLCQKEGAKVRTSPCDVGATQQVDNVIRSLESTEGRVDILVNCAGICGSKPILHENFDSMWRDMNINFGGPLRMILGVLPMMKTQQSGCIINIASRAGTVATPFLASYCASKAALIKLTESIQLDLDKSGLGDKIQSYCCHPGGVQSGLTRRPMDPAVAEAYPAFAAQRPVWVKSFVTEPRLCGAVCVFLATGRARHLRGRYIDVEFDVEAYLRDGVAEEITEGDLHTLRVIFAAGAQNDGGSARHTHTLD